jgi:hypothetical protein
MDTNPVAFFETTFPQLFNQGIADLRAAADGGDATAKAKLEDTLAAAGTLYARLEGAGEVWVTMDHGVAKGHRTKPASPPIRVAIEAEAEPLEKALQELEKSGLLQSKKAPTRIARLASKRIEDALKSDKIEFHVVIQDTPDFDEVIVKIGLNVETPPETPRFTATLKFDDLEAVRAGKIGPQQLLMGGKMKLTGDASRAMALGMQLMQPPRK